MPSKSLLAGSFYKTQKVELELVENSVMGEEEGEPGGASLT